LREYGDFFRSAYEANQQQADISNCSSHFSSLFFLFPALMVLICPASDQTSDNPCNNWQKHVDTHIIVFSYQAQNYGKIYSLTKSPEETSGQIPENLKGNRTFFSDAESTSRKIGCNILPNGKKCVTLHCFQGRYL